MEWIVPIITVVGSVGGAYLGVRVAVAELSVRVRAIETELGTHETGLRGQVHAHTSAILKLDGRVTELEARRRR